MINIKFSGHKAVINRIIKLGKVIEADIPRGLEASAPHLRDGAITNLIGSIGMGRWGPWGRSSDSIRDKSKWQVNKISPTKVELTCLSTHALVVEKGGIGKVFASQHGHKAWPIGRAQGREEIYRPYFTLQQGYHYTTRAMNNPSVKALMSSEIARIIRESIAKVAV